MSLEPNANSAEKRLIRSAKPAKVDPCATAMLWLYE